MMADLVAELLRIVGEQIDVCRALVVHARHRTGLLASADVEALLASNRIEEEFCAKLQRLEKERASLCHDACSALGMLPGEFTLMKLTEKLDHPSAGELRSQANLLKSIVKELRSVTRRNMRVIEKSIAYSQGLLALMSEASSGYQQTGLLQSIPSVRPTFSQRA